MLANRVAETSTTTGTGTLDLAGAKTGHHAFADKFASGALVRYVIAHQSANEFEYGLGAFTNASPDTLARTTVLGGSNGTSAVNLSAGTKDVFCDALAEDAPFLPTRLSGRRYLGHFSPGATNGTVVLNTLYAAPFYVGDACAFDGISIVALGTASAYLRLGLYRDNGGFPDALIVDAGQVDCASAGEKVAAISETLTGIVWVAGVGQGVAPSVSRLLKFYHPIVSSTSPYSSGYSGAGYSQTGVSGALPDPWGSTYNIAEGTGLIPQIALRVA